MHFLLVHVCTVLGDYKVNFWCYSYCWNTYSILCNECKEFVNRPDMSQLWAGLRHWYVDLCQECTKCSQDFPYSPINHSRGGWQKLEPQLIGPHQVPHVLIYKLYFIYGKLFLDSYFVKYLKFGLGYDYL